MTHLPHAPLCLFFVLLSPSVCAQEALPASRPAESRPAQVPLEELDARELGKAWGTGLDKIAGPMSEEPPVIAPPIRPAQWLVVDAGGPAREAREAFVARYVLDLDAPPPKEGEPGPLGGETRWRKLAMPATGEAKGEFAFAYATVVADSDHVRMARLPGADALFVNGDGFIGDPERRGYRGVPVALRVGVNHLFVSGIHGGFELELWQPGTRMVIARWDLMYPRYPEEVAKPSPFDTLVVPCFNASLRSVPAASACFHYEHARPGDMDVPKPDEFRCDSGDVLPLGLWSHGSPVAFGDWPRDDVDLFVPIAVFALGDSDGDRVIARVRPRGTGAVARPRRDSSWPFRDEASSARARGSRGGFGDGEASIEVVAGKSARGSIDGEAIARHLQQHYWYELDVMTRTWSSTSGTSRWSPTSGPRIRIALAPDSALDAASESWLRLALPARPRYTADSDSGVLLGTIEASDARGLRILSAIDLCDESLLAADIAEWRATRGPNPSIRRVR